MPRTATTTRHKDRNMGACLTSDGVAGSRARSDSNLTATGAQAFSFGAWVFFENPAIGVNQIAVHYDAAPADPAFGVIDTGAFYFATANTNPQSTFAKSKTWHHMVQTYDGITTHNFYVDGLLSGTRLSEAYNNTAGPLYMMGFLTTFSPLKGRLDETFVIHSNLSLAQVQDIYFRGTYPTTNLLYMHNNGSGTVSTDSSGTGNNATLTGGMGWSTEVKYQLRTATSSRSAASGRTQIT